jgi:hypothetical protein
MSSLRNQGQFYLYSSLRGLSYDIPQLSAKRELAESNTQMTLCCLLAKEETVLQVIIDKLIKILRCQATGMNLK